MGLGKLHGPDHRPQERDDLREALQPVDGGRPKRSPCGTRYASIMELQTPFTEADSAAMLAFIERDLEEHQRQKRVWRADLETFAREALVIRPAEGAAMPFEFNSVQRKLHALLENQKAETGRVRAVILKARQMGVSTYVGARFYHRMRHDTPGFRTIIMASTATTPPWRSRRWSTATTRTTPIALPRPR